MNNEELPFQRLRFGSGHASVRPICLALDEIHIWGLVLDIDETEYAHACTWLSEDERERASRLVSEQHRRRYIVAHAGLRRLLGGYLGNSAERIVIERTQTGKPFLRDWSSICFNLSHSHGRALVAITKERDVGVDLEQVRPSVDVMGLAKRFLSPKDQAFIEHGESTSLHQRFLKTWVAREAVYKAVGTGLTFPLKEDHIELTENGTGGYLVLGRTQESKPVRFLPLEPEWIGAVSSGGTDWTIGYPIWDESGVSLGT